MATIGYVNAFIVPKWVVWVSIVLGFLIALIVVLLIKEK